MGVRVAFGSVDCPGERIYHLYSSIIRRIILLFTYAIYKRKAVLPFILCYRKELYPFSLLSLPNRWYFLATENTAQQKSLCFSCPRIHKGKPPPPLSAPFPGTVEGVAWDSRGGVNHKCARNGIGEESWQMCQNIMILASHVMTSHGIWCRMMTWHVQLAAIMAWGE